MNDRAATLISGRRERLAQALGHALAQPASDDTPLSDAAHEHLFDEARNLYWNELEWEHITEEEAMEGAPLAELIFPGLLAFVRGLLLVEVKADALARAEPRPQVVDGILRFLAGRVLELEETLAGTTDGDERTRLAGELQLTDRLLNLVLYEFHGLSDIEVERIEGAQAN